MFISDGRKCLYVFNAKIIQLFDFSQVQEIKYIHDLKLLNIFICH